MTAQELMRPRYEVIAPYPGSPFAVGDVTTDASAATYPHLFRRMEWWEGRKADEMPKKVVFKGHREEKHYNVVSWDMDEEAVGWLDEEKDDLIALCSYGSETYGFFPED